MLLQISEPNQSPKPHQHRYAIGIDLGTTHSLVAVVRSARSDVLTLANGDNLLPSVVYYGDNTRAPCVGNEALTYSHSDPANTLISAKRFMGRAVTDIKFSHPYQLTGHEGQMLSFVTASGDISPVQASAQILHTLYQTASSHLPKDSISGAVITVPAYFDEAQRSATRDAATAAGIHVLRLLNEPTAAAVAYGLDKHLQDNTILVYDLGGGTFDVSILSLKEGVFEVLATGGNSALGGDDIDRLLANYLFTQSTIHTPTAQQKAALAKLAKTYKETLSTTDSLIIDLPEFGINTLLTHTILADIISPVINRTLKACTQVLADANLAPTQIDHVILVGGSTRMPTIAKAVGEFFGKTPLAHLNPDEVVAIGAAIVANQLINKPDDSVLLLDVTPLSLGLETMGGLVEVIIPRNTPIPIKKRQEFTTHKDGQTGMLIHVVQGERDTVAHCRSLARFELFGIPPMKAGLARIEVTFAIDVNGQLTVSAEELSTHTKSEISISPSYGLSEEQQAALLQAGFSHAKEDKVTRALIEAKVEAERELLAIDSALIEFGSLLTTDEHQHLAIAMNELRQALAHNIKTDIDTKVAALKPISDLFASRIMNNSVKIALSGTHADEWR